MAFSKLTPFLMDSSPFFAQDIILPKIGVSETNKTRYKDGEFHKMYENIRKSDKTFFEYTGMSKKTFDYILENVRDTLASADTNYRIKNVIEAEEKLVLTLRFLSTGMSYSLLSNNFCMGRSTVAKLVYQTCKVIWDTLNQRHMPKPNTNYLQSITEQFWLKWQFPNCIGAIGEKIIKGTKQRKAGKDPKYSNFPMYALQGIADANYKFMAIEVIGKESKYDDTFNTSKLNRRLQNNTFGVPSSQKLPNSDTVLPNVLLGDEGYPLTRYLIRPYHARNLTPEKSEYNKRLMHARKPIKCTYETLFSKWQFLSKPMTTSIKNTKLIIEASCLLHNVIRDIDGNSDAHFQKCVKTFSEIKCQPNKMNNRPNSEALSIRENFMNYIVKTRQQSQAGVTETNGSP